MPPGRTAVDLPENQGKHQTELNATKPLIRAALVQDLDTGCESLGQSIDGSSSEPRSKTPPTKEPDAFYAVWNQVVGSMQAGQSFAEAWKPVQTTLSSTAAEWRTFQTATSPHDCGSHGPKMLVLGSPPVGD